MTLPKPARLYLRIKRNQSSKWMVVRFHDWMAKWRLPLSKIRRIHVKSFLDELLRRSLKPNTKKYYRRLLIRYLVWLHARGHLRFDLRCFLPEKIVLPRATKRFLRHQSATLKKSTVSGYRGTLRSFYQWLK